MPPLSATPSRRGFLATLGLTGLAACSQMGGARTLRVGDQRSGQKSVLEAVHALDDVPYRITWSNFPNAGPLLEALSAEAIDTGYGGDAPFIFAIGSSAGIKTIGAMRNEGAGPVLAVRSNSPVHDISQIKGLRIATPRGSISHNLILAALERQHLPYDAVHFAFLSPQDGEAALRGGAVDGWAIWDPNAALAVRRGGVRLVAGADDLVPSYTLMFASDQAIADKRATLADYRHRLYRAWDWAAQHTDAYAKLMAQETGLDAPLWQKVLNSRRSVTVPIDARLIADQQATADRYVRAGLIPHRIDVAQGFDRWFSANKS